MSAMVKVRGDLADKSWCVLGCAGITAHSAVNRAISSRKMDGAPYKTAVIIGVGGVGLFITLFCKILGVENIIAIDIDEEKTDLARDLGATDAFNSAKIDVQEIKAALPGQGAHLVFEAVGSASTIELGFGLVSEGGLITAVGIAPQGTRASFEITPLVRREFTIKGSFGGNPKEDLGAVVKLAEQGLIPLQKIVNQSYSLKEINTAFLNLGKGITRGRSIIDFTSEGL
jgi:S-(hydroxymethyl)glutathione dehydrogenase/alcohol dehydrogenase